MTQPITRYVGLLLLGIGLCVSLAATATTPQLQIEAVDVQGKTVTMDVRLTGPAQPGVQSMSFALLYDGDILAAESVLPGTAAIEAEKVVAGTLAESGRYNVVMLGLSGPAITEGQIARLTLSRLHGIFLRKTTLQIAYVSLADENGLAIPAQGTTYALRFSLLQDIGNLLRQIPDALASLCNILWFALRALFS